MNLNQYASPFSFVSDSNIGVLVIHGFTGTPASVIYVGQKLHQAGCNIEGPCLSGHGTNWRDMNQCTYNDWIDDVDKALEVLKRRCSIIFLCGLSMGGALALHLARAHQDIKGLILVNHAVLLKKDLRLALLPLARFFIPALKSRPSDTKDPGAPQVAYQVNPLPALHQLTLLMKHVRAGLHKVAQPTLIFKSREDHVVPVRSATYTYERIASAQKNIVWLENSYHNATIDYDKDIICEKSIDFISELTREE